MLADILARHRGPYRLVAVRPTKKGYMSEWLKGEVDTDDIAEETLALLADPRDTIVWIHIWSVRESQFVTTVKGES